MFVSTMQLFVAVESKVAWYWEICFLGDCFRLETTWGLGTIGQRQHQHQQLSARTAP